MANMANGPPPLFVADDKFPDVIAQLEARGWRRFPHDAFPKFDLKWSNYAKIAWPRVGPRQVVNHFQHAVVLSRKDALAARLYKVGSETEGGERIDAFYPRTLELALPRERETLAAWFLYGRAVGVLLAAQRKTATMSEKEGHCVRQTHAAVAYLRRLRQLGAFFTKWSSGLDLSSLDVWSGEWAALGRGDTEAALAGTGNEEKHVDTQEIESILMELRARDVQFDCIEAGAGDVWICKPSNLSQGRGIHLLTDLDALLQLAGSTEATQTPPTAASWVVQKYVERPLLLQNGAHKFDVRQWVLITSLEPLTVYWYTDCYLRFCAHAFSLDPATLRDSFMHLSNYSIQKNVSTGHDEVQGGANMPVESMWHSAKFQDLLRDQHDRDVWQETIVPQMQHATRTAIRAALPEMKQVGRGFEWLGMDFLIDATHRVWLLEVNVSPDVSHSTAITAALVPDATRGVLDLVLGDAPQRDGSVNGWFKMDW